MNKNQQRTYAEEPVVSKHGGCYYFADTCGGSHSIPYPFSLSSKVIAISKNPDEQPDNIKWFLHKDARQIEISACLWYELNEILMVH